MPSPVPGRPNWRRWTYTPDSRVSTQNCTTSCVIPISLPFLWLMFVGRRDVAVYDHAVFSLYSLSFMSLLFITTALLGAMGMSSVATFMVIFVPPIHMFVQVRQTYALGKFAALWRTVALLCVAGAAFTLFLMFIVMINLH